MHQVEKHESPAVAKPTYRGEEVGIVTPAYNKYKVEYNKVKNTPRGAHDWLVWRWMYALHRDATGQAQCWTRVCTVGYKAGPLLGWLKERWLPQPKANEVFRKPTNERDFRT